MILFKPEFVEPILRGEKTVTRRRWKRPRVKVGGVYQARTTMFGKAFANLRVISLDYEECPGKWVWGFVSHLRSDIMEGAPTPDEWREEAHREGCKTWQDFQRLYAKINGCASLYQPCYRIEFRMVEEKKP